MDFNLMKISIFICMLLVIIVCIIYYFNERNFQEKFKKINYVDEFCEEIYNANVIDDNFQNKLVLLSGYISFTKSIID